MNFSKRFLVFLLVISFVNGFAQKNNYDPYHLYSTDELKADFRYLQSSIVIKCPFHLILICIRNAAPGHHHPCAASIVKTVNDRHLLTIEL